MYQLQLLLSIIKVEGGKDDSAESKEKDKYVVCRDRKDTEGGYAKEKCVCGWGFDCRD